MIVLLSPAKNLDTDSSINISTTTTPALLDHSAVLMDVLKKKSAKQLSKLMHLSPQLSDLNFERNQKWSQEHTTENSRPALFTFNGAVYWGINSKEFTNDDVSFAQDHIAILSGLYGVLRPLDLMQPYRLEMGSKLTAKRKKNLYEFWGNRITDKLNSLSNTDGTFINLASNEYFKSIKKNDLNGKIITCHFKEYRNGSYKAIMTYAKTARGLMTNFIVKNRIIRSEDLKGFDNEKYSFNQELSTENEWVFTR